LTDDNAAMAHSDKHYVCFISAQILTMLSLRAEALPKPDNLDIFLCDAASQIYMLRNAI
jgi:hypothetical protein